MKSICPNTFQTMINETIQLVDVRERYEFELYKMNLPIVQNLPFSEIEELFSDFDANKKIVLVCNNSVRSKSFAKYLEDRDFNQIYYLEGGLVKWQQNNLPLLGNPPEIISPPLIVTGKQIGRAHV